MWNQTNVKALLESSDRTTEHNGVGFGAFDAEFCSSLARQVRQRGSLSPKQIAIGRNKIKRYWRQLAEIANESGKPVPEALQALSTQGAKPEAKKVEAVEIRMPVATVESRFDMVPVGDFV